MLHFVLQSCVSLCLFTAAFGQSGQCATEPIPGPASTNYYPLDCEPAKVLQLLSSYNCVHEPACGRIVCSQFIPPEGFANVNASCAKYVVGQAYRWAVYGFGYMPFTAGTMITSASCSSIGLAVTTDGLLWSWRYYGVGSEANYLLGRGATVPDYGTVPLPLVRQAGFNANYAAAVTRDGAVYTWGANASAQLGRWASAGTNEVTPGIIPLNGVHIMKVTENAYLFGVVLSLDGRVYTWGRSNIGTLGRNVSTANPASLPGVVDLLLPFTIVDVATGSDHAAAVTSAGAVYTWGGDLNALGRTIVGSFTNVPGRVVGLDSKVITNIACGNGFCMALTSDGAIYSWGSNGSYRLGHSFGTTVVTTPAKVQLPAGVIVTSIDCGPDQGAAVTTDFSAYTWGYPSDSDNMGHSNCADFNCPPTKVDRFPDGTKNQKIYYLNIGGGMTIGAVNFTVA